MVTRVAFFASMLMALAVTAAAAQEPPPVPPPANPPVAAPPVAAPAAQEPLPAVTPPPPPAAASHPAQLPEQVIRERRKHVSMMEGMFIGAVKSAAHDMSERMEALGMPPLNQMSGSLTARGWMLDGYGVFFAVEIPGVTPSVASLQMMRERLFQGDGRPSPPQAMRTAEGATSTPMVNPDAEYVELVKNALIDAMVDYSKPLELQPHEWLTVAAGDGDEPLNPAFLVQRSTMILRVRGSDIADYLAGRLSKDAVRKKVEVRKF